MLNLLCLIHDMFFMQSLLSSHTGDYHDQPNMRPNIKRIFLLVTKMSKCILMQVDQVNILS